MLAFLCFNSQGLKMFEDQVVIKIKKKQGKRWDVRDHQKPKVLALFRLFDHI
jgi:hypothetical protein